MPIYRHLKGFSVSSNFARLLAEFAESQGLEFTDLLPRYGLTLANLHDPLDRIEYQLYAQMLDGLALELNEPHVGLKLGQTVRLAHLGTSGLLQMACSTVEELLPRMARYNALILDAFEDHIEVTADEVILQWRSRLPAQAQISRHHAELNFALTQCLVPQFTGEQITPTRVSFRHPPPLDPQVLDDFFQCEVSYNAPVDLMACHASILSRSLHAPDPHALKALDRLCENQLKALEALQEPDWLRASKQSITRALKNGQPEFSRIAEELGYGPRQLRRKLSERGLNFRRLVDQCRQDLAQVYIEDFSLSLVDVAMLLGFSEQSAFQRAYRRWSGEAPGIARRRLMGQVAPRRGP